MGQRRDVRKGLKRILRAPANALVASSSKFSERLRRELPTIAMESPAIAAKYHPFLESLQSHLTPASEGAADDLPLPPEELWLCVEDSAEFFLRSGEDHVQTMLGALAEAKAPITSGQRILDFGCGAGRMIRWLTPLASDNEIWGCDIRARHILWCSEHMSPPFRFFTNTTLPHLPFEDDSFDVIYAGSVFTHISDLADAWILELRRTLKPGGHLYATVHDEHSIKLISEFPPHDRLYHLREDLQEFDRKTSFSSNGFRMFIINRLTDATDANVFYDRLWLEQTWGRLFAVRSVIPEAFLFQTAFLLQKHPR
jgi:SAM-dependent methyltransferase